MKKITPAIIFLLMLSISSCKFLNKYESYGNANSYHTINENGEIFLNPIKNINIDWVNGSVDIFQSDEYTSIAIFEKTNSEKLDEKYKCKLLEQNRTDLNIKYCSSAISMPANLSKSLKIYIPIDYTLDNISINNVTANLSIKEIKLNNLSIYDVKGKTNIHNVEALSIDYSGVSGTFISSLLSTTSNVKVNQVSGKTILSIPSNIPGFTLIYDSVSGKLTSDYKLLRVKNEYYYNQKDYLKINVNSTSGDLVIANYDAQKEPVEKESSAVAAF